MGVHSKHTDWSGSQPHDVLNQRKFDMDWDMEPSMVLSNYLDYQLWFLALRSFLKRSWTDCENKSYVFYFGYMYITLWTYLVLFNTNKDLLYPNSLINGWAHTPSTVMENNMMSFHHGDYGCETIFCLKFTFFLFYFQPFAFTEDIT